MEVKNEDNAEEIPSTTKNEEKLQEVENEIKTIPGNKETSLTKHSSSVLEEELDISSEQFNPLRLLYANDYRVSAKEPKVLYQNMAAFETAFKKVGIFDVGRRPKKGSNLSIQAGTSQRPSMVQEETMQRRFQEHQMTQRTQVKIKNKHNRNILTQMGHEVGPLKLLNDYVAHGKRVRVVIRKEKGVKGYVEGNLEMFDRHWNLLLTDVEECFNCRKYKYCYDDVIQDVGGEYECSQKLNELGITLPTIDVKNLNRKNVQIKRYLKQILLRGEHVVLINLKNE